MGVGVNIMFPLEVAAGCDAVEWRERFGPDMCIRGGLDKRAVPLGKEAVLKEFERIRPAFEQGKFIPHLDHLVPPEISLDQYRRYLDIKREFIGK
jgi:uroporphyrinogen decarboxylase